MANTSWMLAQRIYSMVLSLVVGAISAQYLGPSNYGVINYAASYVSIATMVSGLGLDSIIIAESINNRDRETALFGTAITMRLVASLVSFAAITILAFLWVDDKSLQIVFVILSFGIVIQTYELITFWFQLKLLMKYVAIANAVAITGMSIWKIVLLMRGATVEWFAVSTVLQGLICSVIVISAIAFIVKVRFSFDRGLVVHLLKTSYNELLCGVFVASYMHMDKIMLGNMIDQSMVGLYTAAMTLAVLWQFIPMAIIDSSRPLIIARKKKSEEEYHRGLQKLYLTVTVISFVFVVAYLVFGKLALRILYGDDYMGAIGALKILTWATFISMIGSCRSVWIAAEGFYKYDKYFTGMTVGANVFLNYWLIRYMGIEGAAMATVISYFFEVFIAPAFFKETIFFLRSYIRAIRNAGPIIKDILASKELFTIANNNEGDKDE